MLNPNATRRRARTTTIARTSRRSASEHLSRISKNKVPPQDAQGVLTAAFEVDDYVDCIRNLIRWEIDPQAYVNGLDQIINVLSPGSGIYYRCLRVLRQTCGIYGILPTSYLMGQGPTLVTTGTMRRPFASGGFSDVWKARNDDGQIFAIKQLRTYESHGLQHVKKKYCKEVTICRRIRHENVLNIEGVAPVLFEFCMVSRWMDNGNMLDYVRTQRQVDRMGLLIGVARDLHHLHSNELVHGDLKGPNILIDPKGNPLLADFGLSSITKNPASVNASTPHSGGTIRWAAPELISPFSDKHKKQPPTAKSDMYALSMVIIELYTGNIPFANRPDPIVILMVTRGDRPPKPVHAEAFGLSKAVWDLTTRCWHNNPAKRPDTSTLLVCLGDMKAEPPSSFLKRLKRVFAL